jgi:prolyl-tRNA editing enzyme YbaK/EbsC (Cys-tRNA(Pro) deacylase)
MSVDSVKEFFVRNGFEDPVFELGESGATVELAAQTLHVEPALIAKTLAFKVKDKDVLYSDKGRCQDRQQEIQGLFQGESKDAGS